MEASGDALAVADEHQLLALVAALREFETTASCSARPWSVSTSSSEMSGAPSARTSASAPCTSAPDTIGAASAGPSATGWIGARSNNVSSRSDAKRCASPVFVAKPARDASIDSVTPTRCGRVEATMRNSLTVLDRDDGIVGGQQVAGACTSELEDLRYRRPGQERETNLGRNGLLPLAVLEILQGLTELLFCPLAFGDVADEQRESERLADRSVQE